MKFLVLTHNNIDEYLTDISECHKSAFSDDHLTAHFSLAKTEEYYRFLIAASELSVVALDQRAESGTNFACGYIVAGTNVGCGISEFVKANKIYLCSVVIRRPRFLLEKLIGLIRARTTTAPESAAKFRLTSIGIHEMTQSKGVGRKMLSFFESALLEKGVGKYGLSVRSTNESAISFYNKNGFEAEFVYEQSEYLSKSIPLSLEK